ncbi:MAG: S9 family peptidase, partial [Fidelibacterota bacterium]
TFDKIFKKHPFHTASLGRFVWIPGDDAYAIAKKDTKRDVTDIYRVDLISNDTTMFLAGDSVFIDSLPVKFSSFSFSPDGQIILFQENVHRIWRHSRSGKYIIYNRLTNTTQYVAGGDEIRNVKFSPNSAYLAYVKEDNNLYYFIVESGKEKRLTKDGSETILNGAPGWVYEEEFGLYDGFRWSPDSRRIAFWRENQSLVRHFPLVDHSTTYPTIKNIYYPKAGDVNPSMKIGIVPLGWGFTEWVEMDENSDVYYPRMDWVPAQASYDGEMKLCVTWLNRQQNHLRLWFVDPGSGEHKVEFEDLDSCWVNVTDDTYFLAGGDVILTSERDRYRHIYRLSPKMDTLEQLTQGSWEVTQIVRVDTVAGYIYFYGGRDGAVNRNLYRISVRGGDMKRLTPGDGYHSADFSPTGNYFIHRTSAANRPPQYILRTSDGDSIRSLAQTDTRQFMPYRFSPMEFLKITTDDGYELDASIIKPHDFDPTKSYPVIINGYGLPNSKMVYNYWRGRSGYLDQLLAQEGYIIFRIDNRQTDGYGKDRKNLGYGDVGKWMIYDTRQGLNYLGSLGWADTSRVGVWGWSGGGYYTALLLTAMPDAVDVGVAVAPVTDWKYYDTIYTERYMDLPQNNPEGYEAASVLTYAAQLKGKLLLLHGDKDDNVHVQNTLMLANEIVKQGKDVDMFIYPGRNHGIYGDGATYHVFRNIYEYFRENL